MNQLHVTSPCFAHNGPIPLAHTGYGDDRSPTLILTGLDEHAVSLAVILNDMDHPIPSYTLEYTSWASDPR